MALRRPARRPAVRRAGRYRDVCVAQCGCDFPATGQLESDNRIRSSAMIILGIILLLIGWLAGISILTTIGLILIVVGVVLMILGRMGTMVGGRSHWY
jgi:hypothetical protein